MFRTQILRSAATLQASHIAPKQVMVSVNAGYISSMARLYAKKVPYVLQWGFLLGTMLGHPFLIKGFINKTHINGHDTPANY